MSSTALSAAESYIESITQPPFEAGPFVVSLGFHLRDPHAHESNARRVVMAWLSNDPDTGVFASQYADPNRNAFPLLVKHGHNDIDLNVEPQLPDGASVTLTVNDEDQSPANGLSLGALSTDNNPLYLMMEMGDGLFAIGPILFS